MLACTMIALPNTVEAEVHDVLVGTENSIEVHHIRMLLLAAC